MFDVSAVRGDFPILSREVYGKPLVYLDNAATAQVPECVLERVAQHYRNDNGNVHRGVHFTANASTRSLEDARRRVAAFIGAESENSVVFTRGTTEALNTVAGGLRHAVGPGDVVVSTVLEHHSNYVPWQQLARRAGARFEVVGIDENGDLNFDDLARVLTLCPKVMAVTCCSNVVGCVTDVARVVRMAHDAGALVVLDGAQIMRHRAINVAELGCDFFAFSGHKMCAGTGIGVLYGRPEAFEQLTSSEFGGEMVDTVEQERTTFAGLPLRFEAGTPNYVGAIALAAAMDYLESVGRAEISAYEDELVAHAVRAISGIEGTTVLGNPAHRSGCVTFTVEGVHHFDLCALVDKMGVALRSGHNCAQPIMRAYGITGASRLSPAFYNTHEEIDAAVAAIERAVAILRAAR